MPSPFPGMDPFLEGHLWPDLHHALASKIRQILAPRLRPQYTVRIEIYVVEDSAPESEIGIMYPDVEILHIQSKAAIEQKISAPNHGPQNQVGIPATLTIPVLDPIEVRIANVEVRDAANNQLVTCIEILSPVNKREPGLATYRQKRQRLYQGGVHLLELDLLRRGTRAIIHPRLPASDYLLALTRARSESTELWPLSLRHSLPTITIPLREGDTEVPLELGEALTATYDEAGYDLSIDYRSTPPPPALSAADAAWAQDLVT